jgi:hypothetical protein
MKAINKDVMTLGVDLQKAVVITSNELISSKITNSIASQSLTVTDPQPKETHFDKTNQTKPISGSN